MGDYSKFISNERRSVPTPADLVSEGKCIFGTFDKEFETMDLLDIDRPTALPNIFNKLRLSLWEAAEVCFDEGILLAAVSDMSLFGVTLHLFFDKRTGKLHEFRTMQRAKKTNIASNLLNSITEAETSRSSIRFENDFGNGKCNIKGRHKNKSDEHIEYELFFTRLSKPSVVSIPLEDIDKRHRPMYSQKDFFNAEGIITINGETITLTNGKAIVDDHKGYYPRRSHYDWITTMGENNGRPFAVNLTRNQSVDQDKYNENLIWFDNATSLLPPVIFTRDIESKDFKDHAVWKIKDDYGMVDVTFDVKAIHGIVIHTMPVASVEYYILFGCLNGFVLGEDGNRYFIENMPCVGEDKTMVF